MDVGMLDIPAELSARLHITEVAPPQVKANVKVTLPDDIDRYPFSRYADTWSQPQGYPLQRPLTPLDPEDARTALEIYKLILRFTGEPDLGDWQERVLGNYIVEKGQSRPALRDEILAQLAYHTWEQQEIQTSLRGWLLFASCLSAFTPSPTLDKALLYVSDQGPREYRPLCQHKLLTSLQLPAPTGRTYPPTQLEWSSNQKRGAMVLEVHTFNETLSAEVESWTTGEQLASWLLSYRGVMEAVGGWSVSLVSDEGWSDLAGSDFVMDLLAAEEADVVPSQGASSSINSDYDVDEFIPPAPAMQAPGLPPFEGNPWRGRQMDAYVDNLFDSVQDRGPSDLDRAAMLSRRMRGGGGIRPMQPGMYGAAAANVGMPGYGATPMMPTMPMMMPQAPAIPDPMQVAASQQALIQQQALLMAQQMTMQALSLSQQQTQEEREETTQTEPEPPARTEPTSSIRDIIKQFNSRPQPEPKPYEPVRYSAKPFLKKSDPKAEALAKLRNQAPLPPSPPPPPPPAADRVISNSMREKQRSLLDLFSAQPPPPSPPSSPPPAPEPIYQTIPDHPPMPAPTLVFYPRELFNSPYVLNLLCEQIMTDTFSDSCVRIDREERRKMKDLLNFNVGPPASSIPDDGMKKRIIIAARDNWENYFARLFPVALDSGDAQVLGVSHRGICLLKMVKASGINPKHLRLLKGYGSGHVVALKSFVTDDKSLLSFTKGDVIRLLPMEGLQGWQFGTVGGRSGLFPEELTQPSAAPDYHYRHLNLMLFMGDVPMKKNISQADCLSHILLLGKEKEMLRDEIFCQVIKQNTNNPTSSCTLGWRLLVLVTGFFPCSGTLHPYIMQHLHDISQDYEHPFKLAAVCQDNLDRSVRFGGRRNIPSHVEMDAILAGKTSRRITILFPGNVEFPAKIRSFSLVLDVMKDLCNQMGISQPEEMQEFSILAKRQQSDGLVRPLHAGEYLFDFLLDDGSISLSFRRIMWGTPLSFENDLFLDFHYQQSLSSLPLFGSNSFPVQKVSQRGCPSPCIVSVNHQGVTFLHPKSQQAKEFCHTLALIMDMTHSPA
uniref:Myosin XVB n=1 Tax=Oryzias melastigma TaxID=30732 RepID=A0A3B3DH99_ORYME